MSSRIIIAPPWRAPLHTLTILKNPSPSSPPPITAKGNSGKTEGIPSGRAPPDEYRCDHSHCLEEIGAPEDMVRGLVPESRLPGSQAHPSIPPHLQNALEWANQHAVGLIEPIQATIGASL